MHVGYLIKTAEDFKTVDVLQEFMSSPVPVPAEVSVE